MRYLYISDPEEAEEELTRIGVDPYGIEAMRPKMSYLKVLLEGIECKVANILKQEMLSIGGDVAVSRGSVGCSIEKTDALIMGTEKQICALVGKIALQPFGLKKISLELKELLNNMARTRFQLTTPERTIEIAGRTLIMGILNRTPDSFSDGGAYEDIETAVRRGIALEEEGADILDVGGESSRPGSDAVSAAEERERVISLIEALKKRITIPISIDTTKAEIARIAVESGAEIINDISSMRSDDRMLSTVARYKVPLVMMHMRGTPKTMQQGDLSYVSLWGEIIDFLRERIEAAESAGIDRENIVVDPGIGFGKSLDDNLRLIKYLRELRTLGRPILVGVSRKAFIGAITGGEPLERRDGTIAAVVASIINGANIVRVHDAAVIRKAVAMTDAIMRG